MLEQQRTHIIVPLELVAQIDSIVGKRGRSRFFVEAAHKELRRLRLQKVLNNAMGAWKDEDHPELKNGSAHWVKQLRKAEERRVTRTSQKKK